MGIEFTDNSAQVKAVLSDGVKAFLYESGGELQSQTMRNSRVDTGQTRGSYQYKVSEDASESRWQQLSKCDLGGVRDRRICSSWRRQEGWLVL